MNDLGQLEAQVATGDLDALAKVFESHRGRLTRMIGVRMDARLNQRVSESDVLQDAFVDAQRRVSEWQPKKMPLFLWLRLLTGQKLIELHRFHVQTQKRSTNREAKPEATPDASTESMAGLFVGQLTTASQLVAKSELRQLVRSTLDQLDPIDREILALRHFEQLTNAETAKTLSIAPSTSSERYVRALEKLRDILTQFDDLTGAAENRADEQQPRN